MIDWWRHRSLRFRLALWYGVGGSLLLSAFGVFIYAYVANRMARPLDYHLRQQLEEVRQKLGVRADGALTWQGALLAEDATWSWDDPWFEIWTDDGRLIRRLWPFDAHRVEQVPFAPLLGPERISIFNVAPDLRLRVLSVPYRAPGKTETWMLRVMRLHEPLSDPLAMLRWIIGLTLPAVIGLLVIGGYLITRLWLKPLDEMIAQAEGITAEQLDRRLTVTNPRDELGRLAAVFNHTLDRLEDSFASLDRFVADASHELRTPLTTMRSVGEVGLRRSRSVEEYREIIGSMLEEAQRLHQLVERLLELATAESGMQRTHLADIKLDEFVASCIGDLSILAEGKSQQIQVQADTTVIQTDPVLLRQALQNLIDNAMKYSPPGATIRVTANARTEQAVISVTDEGPGIPAEFQTHLADRFFRLEHSRTRGQGGFGLGLALTKAYMRVIGGSLECLSLPNQGSRFTLVIPRTVRKPSQLAHGHPATSS